MKINTSFGRAVVVVGLASLNSGASTVKAHEALVLHKSSARARKASLPSASAAHKTYPPVPDLIMIGMDGINIRLSERRGKVLLIDFWASWCPPCRRMFPTLNSLQAKYKNEDFEIIGISMDDGTTEDIGRLGKELGLNYTIADGDTETEEAFDVRALPTSFLIDRKGRVRAVHRGIRNSMQLQREIKRLLAE